MDEGGTTVIHYRKHSNENFLTPADLLNKAYNEMGADFDLWCEDKYAYNKPHWAFDNYRINGTLGDSASHLFYTQPSWGLYFAQKLGINRVKLLTYAIDEDIYPEVHSDKTYDIGFIGNVIDGDGRGPMLELLKSKYNCFISSDVPTRDITKELSKCKVLFNHIRYEEINIRFFEGLASGAMVCSYSPNLHLFATEGKHYLSFKTDEEAIKQIDYLLANPNKIKKMTSEARKEVLKRHTYKHRVQEIINFL